MPERVPPTLIRAVAVVLCLFTLVEVNYPRLTPQSQLAIFAGLGLALCFLLYPARPRRGAGRAAAWLDYALALVALAACAYVVTQSEPAFRAWWLDGHSLGDRAGVERGLDFAVGIAGLLLVIEAARRTVGWALPLLSGAFLLYAFAGPRLPSWLFPHRGYDLERVVAQTFLHSQGVFGIALKVMFTYVFLFVVFGSLLEASGTTGFIIDYARRLFRGATGAPAKVSVLSSGLMGSLSGSAVANTATTGTFTIPLMKSSGMKPHVAGGIEAAASSGGALVPPVMGAGAYMMLELVDPPVTYLEIIRAALLPALLYYLSIFLMVHFYARRIGAADADGGPETPPAAGGGARAPGGWVEGLIFTGGLGSLIAFILAGFTVFRAVTLALGVVLAVAAFSRRTRIGPGKLAASLERSARAGLALIAAAACVGIVIGVVTLTGVGSKLPATILPLAEHNLFLALALMMVSSIVLGMGLPSAVCYLLLATLIGPALAGLGVVPLAAHLFIFYFGLMSMVTPPVALAAYTAASIADAPIMATAFAAFRFALVGFGLPFLFVYRPELLMLRADGSLAPALDVGVAFAVAAASILALSAALAGQMWTRLGWGRRWLLLALSLLLFFPSLGPPVAGLPASWVDVAAATALVVLMVADRRRARRAGDFRPAA
ncbi:MAG: TRAP transporter fused permease subunit [Acidobacteria bacterium]|nr:MAG: TRAP transporter fused permease subunit [Acidobacteriota bacterium]